MTTRRTFVSALATAPVAVLPQISQAATLAAPPAPLCPCGRNGDRPGYTHH